MIRPATDADARALAELEVRAWRWAYVDVVAEEAMPTVEERVARWTGAQGAAVAEVEGRVVGVVQVGDGELRALYVEPAAQGAGLGSELYDFACAELRAAGSAKAVLWAFVDDGHARGFFERRGWRADAADADAADADAADADGARRERHGASQIRYRQNLGV